MYVRSFFTLSLEIMPMLFILFSILQNFIWLKYCTTLLIIQIQHVKQCNIVYRDNEHFPVL